MIWHLSNLHGNKYIHIGHIEYNINVNIVKYNYPMFDAHQLYNSIMAIFHAAFMVEHKDL